MSLFCCSVFSQNLFKYCISSCYTSAMKRAFVVIGALILFGLSAYYGYNRRAQNPDPNHTHADFAVWINGVQLDFAKQKYMSHVPVTSVPSSFSFIPRALAHEDEPEGGSGSVAVSGREYLHLHDGNGHVVHRHKPGLGFGDFLSSIGFTLTSTCLTTDEGKKTCNADTKTWQFFVNGKEITPLPVNYVFADDDQLLLTYGADAAEVQKELSQMTDDACKYSKTCPGHGTPPTENCIADPTVPCVAQ